MSVCKHFLSIDTLLTFRSIIRQCLDLASCTGLTGIVYKRVAPITNFNVSDDI